MGNLIEEAEKAFNSYIRGRDTRYGEVFQCVSCLRQYRLRYMHAGHYLPKSTHLHLRFHEDNVHGQCFYCNIDKHGNKDKYRSNLLKRIGSERVLALESIPFQKSHTTDEDLINLIKEYKLKLKAL